MDIEDNKSSGSSPGEESLDQKHNRLLTEFTKVRSQLAVLKNGFIEEKNTVTELKNQMRQKDQTIRRLEQETESLRFCNSQVQSRLVVLQKDLKEREPKGKNNKKKEQYITDGPSSTAAELNADFVQLVEINAHLSTKLNSVQSEFESTVSSLEVKLKETSLAAKTAASELSDYKKMYDNLESRIKNESDLSAQNQITELKLQLRELQLENSQLKTNYDVRKSEVDSLNKGKVDAAHQSEIVRKLNQQIESQKEQLLKLQHEREKWMLEVQILKLKNENATRDGPSEMSDSDRQNGVSFGEPSDESSHDAAVQDRLKLRVKTLISDLQYADGKAFFYQAECSALQIRLQLAEESRSNTEQLLADAQHHIDDLKKQMETTVIHTNEQMNVMSEHLATMNEKLQVKTDEINTLKFELQQRPPKSSTKSNHR